MHDVRHGSVALRRRHYGTDPRRCPAADQRRAIEGIQPLTPEAPLAGRPATLEEVVIGHMAAGRLRRAAVPVEVAA